MPTRKSNKIRPVNYIVIDLPAPANITRAWRFGSCLGFMLIVQVVTGLFLASRYTPDLMLAFKSVTEISREVAWGSYIRSAHASGASIFFLLIYIHIARGLIYKRYKQSYTWIVGVTIYIAAIATAFIGYLLPWGQIRFWGATVITNLFSAVPLVGLDLVSWLWGGFAVGNATLRRFYVGHFLLPFIIILLSSLHLLFLHDKGSRNPLGLPSRSHKVSFHGLFSAKDIIGFIILLILLRFFVFFSPYILVDPENFSPANSLVTPTHIKPEWYFLWAYAILRAVPNKLGGVVAMFSALIILYILPYSKSSSSYIAWIIIVVFILLSWIGGSPVEYPYEFIGRMLAILYFLLVLSIYN